MPRPVHAVGLALLLAPATHAQRTHWAYVAPVPAPPPEVRDAAWCKTPIDRFVLARLEREGLSPSPEADRRALLRRASLDLIGLPPAPEEVERFVADPRPDAFEREVDRLLASPRYGERMAVHWLDLARYADTNGYEKDLPRSMSPWRDWVIAALNADLPFDRFTVEQLAGDLLPDATEAQRVATGFHRNTMLNDEGGVDAEEFRVAAVVDRVNTTAAVWLGSTLACAQCHDHKHDPFTQREYYALLAFFDATADSGVGSKPELAVPTEAERRRIERLDAKAAELRAALDPGRRDDAQAAWERACLAAPRARIPDEVAIDGAPDVERDGPFSYGAFVRREGSGCVVSKIDDQDAYRGCDLFVNEGRIEVHIVHHWPDDAIKVETKDPLAEKEWHHVLATYDGSSKAAGIAVLVDGARWPLRVVKDSLRGTIKTEAPWKVGARKTTGAFRGPIEGPRLFRRALDQDEARLVVNEQVALLLARGTGGLAEDERRFVRAAWVLQSPAFATLGAEAAAARSERESIQPLTTMVMQERPASQPTRVHRRGNFRDPGEAVEPGVPAVLPGLDAGLPRNRLGLARWLVDPRHPLTARVAVNRSWQLFFGQGLVRTPDDFGRHGARPSHPDLLDWLAVELVGRKWSQKALHRLIVTSSTYRQGSACTAEGLARDPDDVLLARAPRPRLEAEQIRDQALAVAGLLDDRIFGPSVMPYQPASTWADSFAKYDTPNLRWVEATGKDRFRRGLYTYWRRSASYPASLVFDAARRDVCVCVRGRTDTPLQALVTLNDPVYREAALGLALRMLGEGGIARGFVLCTARPPSREELKELEALLGRGRARFRADHEAARRLVEQGHVPIGAADRAELAALFLVANVLLNLDEVLTRG
jgi:hypothetical protein